MKLTIKLDPQSYQEVIKNFEVYRSTMRRERVPIIEKGMKIIHAAWVAKLRAHRKTGKFETEATYRIDGNGENFTIGHIGNMGAPADDAIGLFALEYGHAFPGQGRDSKLSERNQARASGKKIKRMKKGHRWTDSISKKVAAVPTIRPAVDETKKAVKNMIGSEISRVIKGLKGGSSY